MSKKKKITRPTKLRRSSDDPAAGRVSRSKDLGLQLNSEDPFSSAREAAVQRARAGVIKR